jgi:hypothetical protein
MAKSMKKKTDAQKIKKSNGNMENTALLQQIEKCNRTNSNIFEYVVLITHAFLD